MPAGKWKLYEEAKIAIMNKEVNFFSDSFKINLYLSSSNANVLTAGGGGISSLVDITNQVATAFGYTQDTKPVTLSVTNNAGVLTIDETTNPVWTASGGSIAARYAVIYDDTHISDLPICVCLLDTAPADVVATTGNTFTITMNASGLFTLSGAAID